MVSFKLVDGSKIETNRNRLNCIFAEHNRNDGSHDGQLDFSLFAQSYGSELLLYLIEAK